MNQEIQKVKAVPFMGPILGLVISTLFLSLFFKIPPIFLFSRGEDLGGAFPVVILGIAYIILATIILGFFRQNKYLDMFRVVYWSGLVPFYYIFFLIISSATSWLFIIPVIVFIFPVIIIPIGILLFRGVEKVILKIPLEIGSKNDGLSIGQKLRSLFINEKPKL